MIIGITGEKGFIGSNLKIRALNLYNYDVIDLGKKYLSSINKFKNIDYLIHCASLHRLPDPSDVYKENMLIHNDLVKSLTQNKISTNIVFLSSIMENNGTHYGNSKIDGAKVLNDYCNKFGTKFIKFNLHNTFGSFSHPNKFSFVSTFCYNILNNIDCKIQDREIELCYIDDTINHILLFDPNLKLKITKISILKVYNLIKKFNNTFFKNKDIPIFKSEFELQLFNTFLSFRYYLHK